MKPFPHPSVTAYDACYVALAERLSIPVLTADNRLAAAMNGSPFQVISLDTLCTPATK